jgi:hypothetical protein
MWARWLLPLASAVLASACAVNRSPPPQPPQSPPTSTVPSTPQPGSVAYIMSHPWHPDDANRNGTDTQFRRDRARCLVVVNQIPDKVVANRTLDEHLLVFINCLKAAGWEPQGEGLSSPAQTEIKRTPTATGQQKDALKAVAACMSANDHDDGISDAATIGRTLVSACA